MSISRLLDQSISELSELLPKLAGLSAELQKTSEAMNRTWTDGGKLLIAGNGGSAADAMHFAEELVARFQKDRRALAAIALCDPTVITCAGNDFGYERIFARQVEALGRPGDLLILFSTSGNSPNILAALQTAKRLSITTCAFLGRDGGKAKGIADIELIVPEQKSHRIQECHQLLFHTLCEWADEFAG